MASSTVTFNQYEEVSLDTKDVELAEVGKVDGVEETGRNRNLTFSPTTNDNAPTVLTFSGINVATKTNPKKVLLNDISGSITGGFWAIMGASGSGKTTLLSTLSLRLDPNYMDISGDIRLNGREYSKKILKSMSAYVMQDDLLHAELTVFETLNYAAQLRMAETTSKADRLARQETVMNLMGISHCRDTIVGDTRKKGISGGERKRLCVAIELLNHPKLLFLDEPTSGLDSTTALAVCHALKNLSASGECTVVCTIHQPAPKIFNLFDNLILMKQGNVVFQGNAAKSINYVTQLGLTIPKGEAVADFLLAVVSPTSKDAEVVDDYQLKPPVDLSLGYEKGWFEEDAGATSWLNQFSVLCRRNWQQYTRRKDIIFLNFIATSVLSLFICLGVWRNISDDQESATFRAPAMFFCCVCQGVLGSLQSINSFPSERAIMLRERSAGAYHVSSYFAAKSAIDMLVQLWPPILFSCIVYFAIGFQNVAYKFFLFMMFMVLDSMGACALASAVTCICVSVEMSTIVLSCLFEVCRLYGGYYFSPLQVSTVPGMYHWKFADALSYIKYAYVGIALNELHDLELVCPKTGKCGTPNGHYTIVQKGYDQYTIGFCAGILVVLIVGWRFIAYLGLRFIRS